jgi:zeaxanthin epoxidase
MTIFRNYAVAALALTTTAAAFTITHQQTKNIRSLHTSLAMSTIDPPVRTPETPDRVKEVRERFRSAGKDAANARGCASPDQEDEWWRTPEEQTYREVTKDKPLRVIVTGGGVAGLVTAAACHAKGMKVAIFEQASQYAHYGGRIQIQSNALRALERINPVIYEEIIKAGTVTADRVSGLKIGYKKGVFLGLGKKYEKGDWLVKFDTLQPALQAGLPATVVVDRPVIQQILLNHGIPDGTVRIKSRIRDYEELGDGKGLKVRYSFMIGHNSFSTFSFLPTLIFSWRFTSTDQS